MWTNKENAEEKLRLCREQKYDTAQWWEASDMYYHNTISQALNYDPSKLTQQSDDTFGIENLISFGTRIWLSIFMSMPFNIEVLPAGQRHMGGIKKDAADGLTHVARVFKARTNFKDLQIELGLRSLIYNACFMYDGWDMFSRPGPKPFMNVIGHQDAYVDPAVSAPFNEDGGPRFGAVIKYLYGDQVVRRYGEKALKVLKPGLYKHDNYRAYDTREVRIFKDMYPVVHWWGIDDRDETISADTTNRKVRKQFVALKAGEFPMPADEDNHAAAIKEGNKLFLNEANRPNPTGEKFEDLETAAQFIFDHGEDGRRFVKDYSNWASIHRMYVEKGIEGGSRPKYPSGIYHCEFQEGIPGMLRGPEPSPYNHGQIPISYSQRHKGLNHYWSPGLYAEALPCQTDFEFLRRRRNVYLHYASGPPFLAYEDTAPESWLDPETGKATMQKDLEEGPTIVLLRGGGAPSGGGGSHEPHFVQIGALSYDVERAIQEKKAHIMEIFGASEVMRGIGPGAEASGKHIQLKQEAASRPSTFMLTMLESPLQKYFERFVSNVIQFADATWLSTVCSPEQVQAIETIKQIPDFKTIVKVTLGSGMPTDWGTRSQIYSTMLQMGGIDPFMYMEELGIPEPDGARERYEAMMEQAQMQQQQPPGGASQGAPPG